MRKLWENSEEWRRLRKELPMKGWEKEKKVWVIRMPFRRGKPGLDDIEEVTLAYAKRYTNSLIGPFSTMDGAKSYITNYKGKADNDSEEKGRYSGWSHTSSSTMPITGGSSMSEEMIESVMLSKTVSLGAKRLANQFRKDIDRMRALGLDDMKDVIAALGIIAHDNGLDIKLFPRRKIPSLTEIFLKEDHVETKFGAKQAMLAGFQLGVVWSEEKFSPQDLAEGMNVELEHGFADSQANVTNDDTAMTAKIALAHLRENPSYYKKLKSLDL